MSADDFADRVESYIDPEDPLPHRARLPASKTTRDKGGKQVLAAPFMLSWKAMREQLYMEQRVPYTRLPKFVEKTLRLLWDTNEKAALRAMVAGDVSFFIAWMFRFDIIDVAMIDAGNSLADRSPLIRFRAAIDGYREVAEKRLKKLGGTWPPVPKSEKA